jgi:phosphoribosylglycinamide formyltransferase 2
VTLISQNLSEFDLHLRAVLGLPIPSITTANAAASRVILAESQGNVVAFSGVAQALTEPDTNLLLFGKREARPGRRMGVALARSTNIKEALAKADRCAAAVKVQVKD